MTFAWHGGAKGDFTDSGVRVKEADRNVLVLRKASVRRQGESRAPTDTPWFITLTQAVAQTSSSTLPTLSLVKGLLR